MGTTSQRKEMVMKIKSLSTFMEKFYIPMLNKYAYHLPHVILLGKNECVKIRRDSLLHGDIETIRDYAERLSFEFDKEIMSSHFGNSLSLSMEGVSVRFIPKNVEKVIVGRNVGYDNNLIKSDKSQFHSHLSDSKIKNSGSTNQHMNVLLNYMKTNSYLRTGGTLYCNCDGAAKQYRCSNALYYLSCLATKFAIHIDRAISAPGHGKDVVDGLNAVDKHYLKQLMRRTMSAHDNNVDSKKNQNTYNR